MTMKYSKLSKNVYRLPFDKQLNLKSEPAPKHYESMINALDFAMPEGTPVYAAMGGIVVEVKDDSNIGGSDESFRKHCNLVRIKHKNDEYTGYVHLKYKGVCVKEGQKVNEGKLIGYSGSTGFASYPHLHFGVYELKKDGDKIHLVIRFKSGDKFFTFEKNRKKFI